jgi:hypothetical protein
LSAEFAIRIEDTCVCSDDQISGKVVIPKPQPALQGVVMRLMVTEKWSEGMQTKSDERELLSYELIDGSPVPSPGIPFLIRLGRLYLWTCPNPPQAKVNVGYRLDVMVKVNQVLKVGATQQISIVQPMAD